MLRGYQEKSSLDVRKELKTNKSVILCLPTGAGKTVVATDFTDRAVNKDITTVFLADREELIYQTHSHFLKRNIQCQLVNAKTKQIYKSKVYVCMAETFYRRLSNGWFDSINIGLAILDEAHTGLYFKIIDLLKEKFPNIFIIGLTATPVSSTKNHPLNKFYNSIVTGPSVPELIKKSFLCQSIDIGHSHVLNLSVKAGEFTAESQKQQFYFNNLDVKMIELWKRHAHNRQTIVYNIDLNHNENILNMFREEGVDACSVHSKMDIEERRYNIYKYQEGRYQVLCNVGVLTKGFNSPQTSCIIVNKTTSSLSLWYQMIGRGGRIFDGKNNFITIDMGNNLLYHGSYNDEIDWASIFLNDSRDKNFKIKKKPKLCPVCSAFIFNFFLKECPICLTEIKLNSLVQLEDMMPDEIKNKKPEDMTLNELHLYGKFKGYKKGWAWFMHMKNINNRINRIV